MLFAISFSIKNVNPTTQELTSAKRCSIIYLDVGASILKQGGIFMDITQGQITKIAQEVYVYVLQTMKEQGVGTAEYDVIDQVRNHPGITQADVREVLRIDKGAIARRTANLEAKGYLIRKDNPNDKRSKLLYATEKAEALKDSKVSLETSFYEWLFSDFTEEETRVFSELLNRLYQKVERESAEGYPHLKNRE